MPKPPKHTYTPEAFKELVEECIRKCKDPEDEYQPCPEQLFEHVGLSTQTISAYRLSKEGEPNYPYKQSAQSFYNYLGIFACKDNLDGNGKQASHINNRVLKYSETTRVEQDISLHQTSQSAVAKVIAQFKGKQ